MPRQPWERFGFNPLDFDTKRYKECELAKPCEKFKNKDPQEFLCNRCGFSWRVHPQYVKWLGVPITNAHCHTLRDKNNEDRLDRLEEQRRGGNNL